MQHQHSSVGRGLTPRSSGAPTAGHAGHQALGLRPILRLLSGASCRRRPLSSNVRPRNQPHAHQLRPDRLRERSAEFSRGPRCGALSGARIRRRQSEQAHLRHSCRPSKARRTSGVREDCWKRVKRPGFPHRVSHRSLSRSRPHSVLSHHLQGHRLRSAHTASEGTEGLRLALEGRRRHSIAEGSEHQDDARENRCRSE